MARGRKPTPLNLRVLNGDHHKARYNHDEPVGSDFDATPPDSVEGSPYALELWDFLVPELSTMGVLGNGDRIALETLCVTYGLWRLKPDPRLLPRIQSLLCEFGLTPSSRTKLVGRLPHEAGGDPKAAKIAARLASR